MVKVERTPTPPFSLATEALKASGSYTKEDVVNQLAKDFNNKCYLCEKDDLDAINIEHLIPHKGNTALRFSWDNLFFSCSHCNSMKNRKEFDNLIIDCCKEEPEEMLWHTFTAGTVHVYPRDEFSSDNRAIATARLLTDCFENKDTAIRVQQCEAKVKALSETMVPFFKMLRAYRKNPCTKTQTDVCGYLYRTYKFAGFTRSYIRMHLEEYPGLAEYVAL